MKNECDILHVEDASEVRQRIEQGFPELSYHGVTSLQGYYGIPRELKPKKLLLVDGVFPGGSSFGFHPFLEVLQAANVTIGKDVKRILLTSDPADLVPKRTKLPINSVAQLRAMLLKNFQCEMLTKEGDYVARIREILEK